jgi:5-methylcytosine-specific restriction endonuclease McrA
MPKNRITAEQKRKVVARANHCCEYCRSQARFAVQSFSVEHIFPQSRGGTNSLDNLAMACQGCNNYKYNKMEDEDPVTGQMVPLYHPRKNRWNEHFSWNNDFTLIIGLTQIGRATVKTLMLNREGVINLRRMLYAMGEHPPE